MKYETVIGLEVHVELATESKIFCSCSAKFGAEQNDHVCPACAGMPGMLPVTNKHVVEKASKEVKKKTLAVLKDVEKKLEG